MNLAEGVRGAGRIVGRRERIGDSVDIRQRSSEAVTRSCQRIIESVVGHRRRQRDARVGRRRAEAVVERRQLRRRRRRRDAHRDVGMSVTVVANDAVYVFALAVGLLLLLVIMLLLLLLWPLWVIYPFQLRKPEKWHFSML